MLLYTTNRICRPRYKRIPGHNIHRYRMTYVCVYRISCIINSNALAYIVHTIRYMYTILIYIYIYINIYIYIYIYIYI